LGTYPDGQSITAQSSGSQLGLSLGPTYRWEPWGAARPWLFKALSFYQELKFLAPTDSGGFTFLPLSLIGLRLEAEYRHGGWSSVYDWVAQAGLGFPFARKGGNAIVGSPNTFIPTLGTNFILRRRVGLEGRLIGGAGLELESRRIGDWSSKRFQISLQFGAEWDL
jgi:hypothetical protein